MSNKKVFLANCSLMSFISAAILLMPAEIHAADATDGAALVKQNSCVACHGMDKKIIGPGFSEIAAKYNEPSYVGVALDLNLQWQKYILWRHHRL